MGGQSGSGFAPEPLDRRAGADFRAGNLPGGLATRLRRRQNFRVGGAGRDTGQASAHQFQSLIFAIIKYTYNTMLFEWDEAKNQANIKKHGIDFETAKRVLDRPALTWPDRRRNYSEDRFVSIGQVEDEALIVVAHTPREGNIRLISARPASRSERQVYHEQIQQASDAGPDSGHEG